MKAFSQTSAWRLWIDRCGGFGLLVGDRFTVGGSRPDGTADVQVRSDWRRLEGTLVRRGGDYFWSACDARHDDERLLRSGDVLPVDGSASLRLNRPSALSGSAVLSLDPPHRFDDHVDQVLLVDQTVLIGRGAGDQIRCPAIDTSAVLVIRNGRWQAKLRSDAEPTRLLRSKPNPQFVDLVPGRRISIGELDMMLEEV